MKPAILVVQAKLAGLLPAEPVPDTCCFSVRNVPMGMALLFKYFDAKRLRFTQWGERHPTAVVHPDAKIGARVFLGPYCVIGARASIGDDCLIGAHAVIENDAQIGLRAVIHPHVFLGAACVLGNDCEIHPHTTIGSDGFGYAVDPCGKPRKITHLGNVQIGNDVEIGGNWSLFCPHEAPGLHECWGEEFEQLYEKYEAEGRARRTVAKYRILHHRLPAAY